MAGESRRHWPTPFDLSSCPARQEARSRAVSQTSPQSPSCVTRQNDRDAHGASALKGTTGAANAVLPRGNGPVAHGWASV
jgi:hypothetical protein